MRWISASLTVSAMSASCCGWSQTCPCVSSRPHPRVQTPDGSAPDAVVLQPELEQADLPEDVAAHVGVVLVRLLQQPSDDARLEDAALSRLRGEQRIPKRALQPVVEVAQLGHGEVALRPVDDLARQQ